MGPFELDVRRIRNCRASRTFRNNCRRFMNSHSGTVAKKDGKDSSKYFPPPRIIRPRGRYDFGSDLTQGVKDMLRKTIVALFAVASIGLLSPTTASARGGFGGFHGGSGGFHGGGFGGFRGGGFHGG